MNGPTQPQGIAGREDWASQAIRMTFTMAPMAPAVATAAPCAASATGEARIAVNGQVTLRVGDGELRRIAAGSKKKMIQVHVRLARPSSTKLARKKAPASDPFSARPIVELASASAVRAGATW